MAFMEPEVYETDYLMIDDTVIPVDVADWQPTGRYCQENGLHLTIFKRTIYLCWQVRAIVHATFKIPEHLRPYTEGDTCYSIERRHGWIARLSASGYMDCPDWTVGRTKRKALRQLRRIHEPDTQPRDEKGRFLPWWEDDRLEAKRVEKSLQSED